MFEQLFQGFCAAVELYARGEVTRAEILAQYRCLWSHSTDLPPRTVKLLGLYKGASYATAVRALDKQEKTILASGNVTDIPRPIRRLAEPVEPVTAANPPQPRVYHAEVEEGCQRVVDSATVRFFFIDDFNIDMALLKILARRLVRRRIGVRCPSEIRETTQDFTRRFQKVLTETLTEVNSADSITA